MKDYVVVEQMNANDTSSPRLIITDIDGTVANIETRLETALAITDGERNETFWRALFRTEYVPTDRPIHRARQVLTGFHQRGIVLSYLSNRPNTMLAVTQRWLKQHDFPPGKIYLRPQGASGSKFKSQTVASLARAHEVICGIGDFDSDVEAYESAGVVGLLVERNSEEDWSRIEQLIFELLPASAPAFSKST